MDVSQPGSRTSEPLADEPITASILMVDDHPANLMAMEGVLAPLGQRLIRATSGSEALARIAAEEFAVVLMDVMMPGLDGFATASLVRQIASGRHVPIVFVTASDASSDASTAYARGAVDILRKPYDPGELRAKVSVFVDLFVQRDLIRRQAALLLDRERLIGVLGHDLRNPLAAIAFSAASALEEPGLPQRPAKALERIVTSSRRMGRMIEDLVDFTRSQHGGLPTTRRECDLRALCHDAIEEISTTQRDRTFEFQADGDCTGLWDPDRLAQVVSNLLSNAVAYSPASTPIALSLRGIGPMVRLEVTNQGLPIPQDVMVTLFDAFKRGDSRPAAGTVAGLGLGLFIVQQIVHAHRGLIRVISNADDGTTFELELPRGG